MPVHPLRSFPHFHPWIAGGSLVPPLLAFVVLMSVPATDVHLGSPTSHFYIVSAAAAFALVMATGVSVAARNVPDARTFFLAMGFVSIATIFLAHGLGTSPLFAQSDHYAAGTAYASGSVQHTYAHGSTGSDTYSTVQPNAPGTPTDSPSTATGRADGDAAQRGRVVGYSARLSIFVSSIFFALAVMDLGKRVTAVVLRARWGLTLIATVLLAGHVAIALWYPQLLAPLPLESAPLSQTIAAITWIALGFAGWRFLQAYRIAILPLQGAMALAMALLIEAQLFMLLGRAWQLSWWLYHVVMLLGFVIATAALLRQYRRTGDFGAIVEGLFLRTRVQQLRRNDPLALSTLTAAIAAKDTETAEHIGRVGDLAVAIAERLAIPDGRLGLVRLAGKLHDVGKIGVPNRILRKPSPLTPEEFEVIKTHSPRGGSLALHSQALAAIAPIVRAHHERMDGTGYPDGLSGEQIPLEARIVAVADVWDALTCARPYRAALDYSEALEILSAESGAHLDPRCVEALLEVVAGASHHNEHQVSPLPVLP